MRVARSGLANDWLDNFPIGCKLMPSRFCARYDAKSNSVSIGQTSPRFRARSFAFDPQTMHPRVGSITKITAGDFDVSRKKTLSRDFSLDRTRSRSNVARATFNSIAGAQGPGTVGSRMIDGRQSLYIGLGDRYLDRLLDGITGTRLELPALFVITMPRQCSGSRSPWSW